MKEFYNYIVHTPYGTGNYQIIINDVITCMGEQYIENPTASFGWEWKATNDDTGIGTLSRVTFFGDLACYYPEIYGEGNEEHIEFHSYGNVQFLDEDGEYMGGVIPMSFSNYTYVSYDYMHAMGGTNIPIFPDEETAYNYYHEEDPTTRLEMIQQYALNYGEYEPSTITYECLSKSVIGTWTDFGIENQDNTELIKGFRIKALDTTKVSLYKIPGFPDESIRLGISIYGNVLAAYYTYDGITWEMTPGQPTTLPFDYVWRERVDELGTFRYAYSLSSPTNNLPLWKSEEDANAYNSGNKDITDAENWDEISGGFPIGNLTGEVDDITEFGQVYTRAFFSQQYICGAGALQEISNALYDTGQGGVWEDIKKGLEMYSNPIEAVHSLMYFPIDLLSVFTNVSVGNDIMFGGYQFTMQNHTAAKIIYPNGKFSCGTVHIKRSFGNWRDMPPYTRLFAELPYCGKYELDPRIYYDKDVETVYYIDTHSGACVCCLIANGHLTDTFNGNMATSLSITMTDFRQFADTQINTLLGNGGQALNNGISLGETGAKSAASGAALGVAGAAGGAAVLGAVQGAKTVYGLTKANINNFQQTKGGSTGNLNQYLNQKVCFTFEILDVDIPDNFYQMNGGPSNKGGVVGNFSGYLEVDTIRLNMPGATESEKEKARALLMGGVFI